MILGGHKITIQRKDRTADGQGGWIDSWSTASTERGKMRPASAREQRTAGQDQAAVTHVAYLRAGADVKIGDRLVLDDLLVGVLAVREPGAAGQHLEVDGVEEQAG